MIQALWHTSAETPTESSQMDLLLVDDDLKFCRLIGDYLAKFGFTVNAVHDGKQALAQCAERRWDAIVLDVMMPGMDGFEVLRKIREKGEGHDNVDTPILMLTALDEETDRIVGLEIGADDYLPKTFSPRELLARIRAVLRRTARTSQPTGDHAAIDSNSDIIKAGDLILDTGNRSAMLQGVSITLTPVEYDLLLVLMQAKGRIRTREQILGEIRDRNYDIFDRSIDVHISGLRKKLGDDPQQPRFVKTVRGAGYLFMQPIQEGLAH